VHFLHVIGVLAFAAASAYTQEEADAFLRWTKDQAAEVGAAMRRTDSVGNRMSFRGLKTERAINYRLRATWLTPEVIRATARIIQLSERLSPAQTQALVTQAEAAGDTVFLIELDPHEGSGVIPSDWAALLQPKGLAPGEAGAVRGVMVPALRDVRALAGVFKRDYAFDAFWVVFPLKAETGAPLFTATSREAELVVSVQGREGVVSWPIPDSVRKRSSVTQ
jgi:hypothetical protein